MTLGERILECFSGKVDVQDCMETLLGSYTVVSRQSHLSINTLSSYNFFMIVAFSGTNEG